MSFRRISLLLLVAPIKVFGGECACSFCIFELHFTIHSFSLTPHTSHVTPLIFLPGCNGDPSNYEPCSTSVSIPSCNGFGASFCDDLRVSCQSRCAAVGCSCLWVEDNNTCESGTGTCHWSGYCVTGPVLSCASYELKDVCIAAGCNWEDNPRGRSPFDPNNESPLTLYKCTQEIQDIGDCLDEEKHPDCLDCSLGTKGIIVPQGGFQNCDQVQQEYCKPGTTPGSLSGGFLTDCCGSCDAKVTSYVKCVYDCPELSCSSTTTTYTAPGSDRPPNLRQRTLYA